MLVCSNAFLVSDIVTIHCFMSSVHITVNHVISLVIQFSEAWTHGYLAVFNIKENSITITTVVSKIRKLFFTSA